MNRFLLFLLISISLNSFAADNEGPEKISTSALDKSTQPYISPKSSSTSKNGFLEENKIAIGTILTSRHFKKYDYYDYNETHNGAYLTLNRWSTGAFTNSAGEQSIFVTYNPELYQNRSLMVNMVTGVANGYKGWENAQGDYVAILGVSAQWMFLKTMLTYDSVTFGMEVPLN